MAYAKRLQIEYSDINSVASRIEIWQEGYTGAVVQRDYASGMVCCETTWGNRGTKQLPVVYGSKSTLYFDSETNFEFHDFFTSNSRKNKILVYKNEVLFHVSYGEADTWNEPFSYPPYEVSFTGYDGLGLLKKVDFLDSNRDYYEGEMTPLAILQLLLSKTGFDLPLNVAVSIRPSGQSTAGNALMQTKKDVVTYQNLNCYEVLEALFNGCRIYQRAGEWWCVSNDKWEAASFSYFRYSSAGSYIGIGSTDTTFTGWWLEGDGDQEFLPALKQMTIVQDYGFKSNLLDNTNFEEINNGTFEGWTAVGVVPEQKTFDNDGNKYLHLPGREEANGNGWYDGDRTKYLESKAIRVSASDSLLKSSVDYALMGPEGNSAYVFYGIRLIGDNGYTYIVEAYKNNDVDGRVAYRWKVSNDLSPIPAGAFIDGSGSLEPETVESYPYNKVTEHFKTHSISIENGIPAAGQMYFYLFLAHKGPDGIVAGNCFRKVGLSFTDENEDELPTDIELVLINDAGNNFVPEDLELPHGDLPDLNNKLTIYNGGFILNDGSNAATTLWAVDGVSGTYTYANLIARYIASEMRLARMVYQIKPADAIPGKALLLTDPVTGTKKFVEAGITYNDRMQTIEGRYIEVVELSLTGFTVGEKINYTSKGSGSSGGGGNVINTDEKVQLVNADMQKTGQPGYLHTDDFLISTDPDSGRTVFTLRNTWAINEIPTGVINGANKIFELANVPVGGVQLFLYPVTILHPNDYTLVGKTITLAAAPVGDEQILANYPYLKTN
ncbi:hypothetical protein [uncultured Draconibacterium sp.]|uniref:hypothetical protein n=1 Tax=uncultured Draconibacterium sp. TaxID=1573823 RepID=UPI0032171E3A